jgi:hypothetical protein
VERNQGGAAGGIDADGGPLEPEGVSDAPGGDTGSAADHDATFEVVRRLEYAHDVILIHHADEDACWAAVKGGGVEPSALEDLPGGLEEQALLRIHGKGFAGADAPEGGVEAIGVVDESPLAHVALAPRVGVRVIELVKVPTAVGREGGDGVGAVDEQLPELFGSACATREPAAHCEDGDGVMVGARRDEVFGT